MNLENKIIEEGNKFFELFKDRFELLKEYKELNAKEYGVSQKESLIVQVLNDNSPKKLNIGSYSLILFSNKKKYDSIRFYGDLRQKPITRKLTNTSTISQLNKFKYMDLPVNHHFILFGSSKRERYIKGILEEWDRRDGVLIMKGNLRERVERLREWERDHPPKKLISYSETECKKANCLYFRDNKCEFGMLPNNDRKGIKLQNNSRGYCFEFENIKAKIFKESFVARIISERDSFIKKYETIGHELSQIHQVKLNSNHVSSQFDRKEFTVLLLLINDIECNGDNTKKEFWEEKVSDLEEKYQYLVSLAEDYISRRISKRPFKKAKKEFIINQKRIKNKCKATIQEFQLLRDNLILRNRLTKKLFKDTTEDISYLDVKKLSRGDFIYFRNFSESESVSWRGSKICHYSNVGRANGENVYLSPLSDNSPTYIDKSDPPLYSIFEVIKVRKGSIDIKEVDSNKVIRLIFTANRDYYPYRIHLLVKNSPREKIINFETEEIDSLITSIKRKYNKFVRIKLIKKGFIEDFYEFREFQILHNDFQIEFRIIENGEFVFNLFNVNQIKSLVRSYTRYFRSLLEAFTALERKLLKNLYKNQKCLLSFI